MFRPTYVVGVGMTKFEKPGRPSEHAPGWDYPDMVEEASGAALADASIHYADIDQVSAGYVYGDSTAGQRALYGLGLTGVPIFNVNNNCSTGSSALMLSRTLVAAGVHDVSLAVGFEKMRRGSLARTFDDRADPMSRHDTAMFADRERDSSPWAPQMFAKAGAEHMRRYGTTAQHLAMIAAKNHRHSSANPRAQFRDVYTVEEILASPVVHHPLTKLQCSPTSDGAAAAVVMSAAAVERFGLSDRAVEIVAMDMVTDVPSTLDGESAISIVGADMTAQAARHVYDMAGMGVEDVQVIELHDCFSTNELLSYEALGLCEPGAGGELIESGDVTYGGRWVVNPSGGLISKGHPLGATGVAQCAELVWQLRGQAGQRQVDGARVGLQHNIGLGGAAIVALYRRPG